ncbi:Transcriptional regulator, AcrR family [hydrothermal vent metagenome]|uniref:Transcriptional regulator, AcrR family n=1 Tax=hydrothermal vent metagenome TaxID=652676 RepID=A0A3B0VWH9_9ZZZZ
MSPRPNVSATRIPQILNAAMITFAEKGFHQATMEDVANEAGLSKGTLYLYFKNKDDLIHSVLQASLEEGFGELEQILQLDELVKPHLLKWLEALTLRMETSTIYLSIGYEFYALASRDEQVRQTLQAYFAKYRALLHAVIKKGVDQGEFKSIDPQVVAIAMIALFEGINVLWYTSPNEQDWATICVQTNHLLLDSISL